MKKISTAGARTLAAINWCSRAQAFLLECSVRTGLSISEQTANERGARAVWLASGQKNCIYWILIHLNGNGPTGLVAEPGDLGVCMGKPSAVTGTVVGPRLGRGGESWMRPRGLGKPPPHHVMQRSGCFHTFHLVK